MKKRCLLEFVLALMILLSLLWISVPRFLEVQKLSPIWSKKALLRHAANYLSQQPNPSEFLTDTHYYSSYTVNKHAYFLNIYSRTFTSMEVNELFPDSRFPLGKTEQENYKIWIDVVERGSLSHTISDTGLLDAASNVKVIYFCVYTLIEDANPSSILPGLPVPKPLWNPNLMDFAQTANDYRPPTRMGRLFAPSNGVTSGGILMVDSIDLGWEPARESVKE